MSAVANIQPDLDAISTPELRKFAKSGQLREVEIRAVPGGYVVLVKSGMLEGVLMTQRASSGMRVFAKADTAVRFLRGLGIGKMTVNAADLPATEKQRDMFEARHSGTRRP